MTAAETEGGGPRRLHPLSLLFQIGASLNTWILPGLLVLLFARSAKEPRYELWAMVAFVPAVVLTVVRYLSVTYELRPAELVLREGWFFKKTRHVPYARIQNIDTRQTPLHRLLGVVEVRLETAGGQEPEAILRVLSVPAHERLRRGILGEGAETQPAEEAGASFLFRMRPGDVALYGLVSNRGLVIVGGALYLAWELELVERFGESLVSNARRTWETLPAWGAGAALLVAVLALELASVAWAFATCHRFEIRRAGEDLEIATGLWTRRTATLPRQRVQFLSLEQGAVQRLFRRASMKVLTAGGSTVDPTHESRSQLVPLAPERALPAILEEVREGLGEQELEWRGVDPRAPRRIARLWAAGLLIAAGLVAALARSPWPTALLALLPLVPTAARARARVLAYALTDGEIHVRDGLVGRVRRIVPYEKIQTVSLDRTPFDRRWRMASVRVDTAGPAFSRLRLEVPYLGLRAASRLARRLRREAAAREFRW